MECQIRLWMGALFKYFMVKENSIMSLKKQKIFVFIPFLNIAVFVCWIKLLARNNMLSFRNISAFVVKAMVGILSFVAIRIVCLYAFDNIVLDAILMIAEFYFEMLVIAFLAYRSQLKIIKAIEGD